MKEVNKNKQTFFDELIRFFEPAFSLRKLSLRALFPAVFISVLSILTIYLLKDITNSISSGDDNNLILLFSIFVILILINYFLLVITRDWTHSILWPSYRKVLYRKFINKYITLDNNEVEKVGTGKLIAMFDKGINSWVDLLVDFLNYVLPNIIFIIFSFIFIAFINIYYLLVVIIIFIIIFYLTALFQDKAKIYREERRDSNILVTRKFVQILMSKFEVLQNKKTDLELDYIDEKLDKNIYYNHKVNNYNISTTLLSKIFIDFSKISIITMFGFGFFTKNISIGEFVSLMTIIYVLDQILTSFIDLYIRFTKSYVEVEKAWDFFDNTPEMKGYDTGENFKYKKGKIEIKNVSYSYVKNNPVFKDFSLKLKGGKVIALVGNSGSGKSTLVKLIAGYISGDSGKIIVDEQEISKISLKSYYKNIGYLTQEASVFDGTILDNLTYAIDRELKEGELENILKQSKCEFIYDLENGLETEIGERGVRLSGGQKQRLAIAKIFLKDPKIIILDEPTSALDSFSEEQITFAMHNLFKGRTVIIIAHRLQTVKEASDIILFENGEIKERGTHEELVKLKGQYKKMLDLQSGF